MRIRLRTTWLLLGALFFVGSAFAASDTRIRATKAVTGTLEVVVEDDFERGTSREITTLEETGTGRIWQLSSRDRSWSDLPSGSVVRVQGAASGNVLEVGSEVEAVETLAVPAVPSGARKAIVIVADFQNAAVTCTNAAIAGMMFDGAKNVDGLYQETTWGQVSFPRDTDGNGQPDVVRVSIAASTATCDPGTWAPLVDAAAQTAGVNLSLYQHRVVVFPGSTACGWAGQASIGCSGTYCRAWIRTCDLADVYAHELGHNLGLSHASTPAVPGGAAYCEYCDRSDFMGYGGVGWRQVNGPHKVSRGWLPANKIVEVTQSGVRTYVLSPLETDPAVAAYPQVLKILRPDGAYDFLSYRVRTGYDATLQVAYADSTSIDRHPTATSYANTELLSVIGDGQSYADTSMGLSVTQLYHDAVSVTLQVTLPASCVDPDADGVCDGADNCPLVANPGQLDTDGDTQGDACDSDDDNDGVADTSDNCPLVGNANQTNTDGDAQGDACDPDDDNDTVADASDNCPLAPNTSQTNTDGDSQGDVCDSDDDNDTVADASDNCPLAPNTSQTNTDGDSLGDVCDPDDDNDTVADASDNCPLAPNTSQTNTDGDSQGDVCDPDDDNDTVADASDNCPLAPNTTQTNTDGDAQGDVCDSDDDNDTRPDTSDNCPLVANADQTNTDGDAQGDACDSDDDNDGRADASDNCPFVANASQTDSDGDGAGDACDACPADVQNDADADGICGNADNCPSVPNPDQSDRDANGIGDACDPLRVNFAPAASAAAPGFKKDDGSAFSITRGYGWDAPVATRERTTPQPLELDTFAFSLVERTWTAEVANGDYDVHVVSGDSAAAQGPHRLKALGTTLINDMPTAANVFVQNTSRIPVRNGRLPITIGGTTGNSLINYIEVLPAPGGPSLLRSINFQPAGSAVPPGFQIDSGETFTAARGYGWSAPVETRDRATNLPQVLDTFALTSIARTWEIVLPNGFYSVWLAVGDARNAQGPQRVVLEGSSVVSDETTAAGAFLERATGARVTDGALTVQIGNGIAFTALDYVVVATAPADADADGLANASDNCPFLANPSQVDFDHDGVGDGCDADGDGDGIVGGADNCPMTPNGAQADRDADHVGDACDPCPDDPRNDPDGDLVCGSVDNCPDDANALQADADGDGLGDVCDFLRVDFGPLGSAVAAGFRKDDGAPYTPARRWGWDLAVGTRERVTAAPIELDTFAFSGPARTWTAELPPGNYSVRLTVGDASYPQGPQRVKVQGTAAIDDATTEAGGFLETTVPAFVRNGRLELQIGGSSGTTTLALVEAVETPGPAFLRAVSFEPAGSPRPPGWSVDSGQTFDAVRGYGWDVAVPTRERGRPVPRTLDTFAFTFLARTWEMAVPNGVYDVLVSVGDAAYAQGPQRVVVEGSSVINGESTAAGRYLERSAKVQVTDGRLTVQAGGAAGTTTLNYVVVTSPGDAP